jgi:hypothetical protein
MLSNLFLQDLQNLVGTGNMRRSLDCILLGIVSVL